MFELIFVKIAIAMVWAGVWVIIFDSQDMGPTAGRLAFVFAPFLLMGAHFFLFVW